MSVLGIIPARKGSKRVPGKNTKLLNGIPLIEYVIRACLDARLLSKTVISSDDDLVEHIARKYNRVDFIKRPQHLATDVSQAIEYVKHVLEHLGNKTQFEIIAIVQPTTPFVRPEDIDGTIQLLLDNEADTAVSVVKVEQMHHPIKLKLMEGKKLLPFLADEGEIKAAHELPDVYSRNGAVYVSKSSVIEKGSIIGDTCLGYVMPFERSIDINYPIDFDFAEFMARKYNY